MNAKQINALRVRANQARREAEAPVRTARKPLADALRRAVRSVDLYNQKFAELIHKAAFEKREPWWFEVQPIEVALANATATYQSRLLDLQLFDSAHGIEADYAQLPVLDREATAAAGRADYERRMSEARARFERPARPPVTAGLFADFNPETAP